MCVRRSRDPSEPSASFPPSSLSQIHFLSAHDAIQRTGNDISSSPISHSALRLSRRIPRFHLRPVVLSWPRPPLEVWLALIFKSIVRFHVLVAPLGGRCGARTRCSYTLACRRTRGLRSSRCVMGLLLALVLISARAQLEQGHRALLPNGGWKLIAGGGGAGGGRCCRRMSSQSEVRSSSKPSWLRANQRLNSGRVEQKPRTKKISTEEPSPGAWKLSRTWKWV